MAINDEEAASSLAQRIRDEARPGTEVTVEGSVQEITQDAPGATPLVRLQCWEELRVRGAIRRREAG